MLVKLTLPADLSESKAMRLLEMCAVQLWGDEHAPFLTKFDVPGDSAAAPFSPKHAETSRRSAQIHAPQAGSEARDVLEILWTMRVPLTAAAITDHMRASSWPRITRNQVAARMWSLRHGGFIEHVRAEDLSFGLLGGPGVSGKIGATEFTTDHDGFVVERTSATGSHYGRVHKLSTKSIRLFTSQEATP